jgi:hypothetical protein
MGIPQITINGKKYTMPKPKIKLWRHIIKFNEAQQNGEFEGDNERMLDEMLELIVIAFNNPDVTKEAVEENVDFEELADFITHIGNVATGVANAKVAQVPKNGVAPART